MTANPAIDCFQLASQLLPLDGEHSTVRALFPYPPSGAKEQYSPVELILQPGVHYQILTKEHPTTTIPTLVGHRLSPHPSGDSPAICLNYDGLIIPNYVVPDRSPQMTNRPITRKGWVTYKCLSSSPFLFFISL